MGVFFRFFFCLYFLLFVHTLWLWFFFFLFFSLYSLHHRSLRARGWVLYNEFFFIITIVFFCLRMNPAHKFRGIFFPFVFFSTGRKKRPRPLDLTDLFCMSFFFCFSLFPPCCRPAAYRAALVGRLWTAELGCSKSNIPFLHPFPSIVDLPSYRIDVSEQKKTYKN